MNHHLPILFMQPGALVISPHPDDAQIAFPSTLRDELRHIHLTLTRGEAGKEPQKRLKEHKNAVSHLGKRHIQHDLGDGQLGDANVIGVIAAAVDYYRPPSLITFGPGGLTGHPDHIVAYEVARVIGRRYKLPVFGRVSAVPFYHQYYIECPVHEPDFAVRTAPADLVHMQQYISQSLDVAQAQIYYKHYPEWYICHESHL